MATRRREQRPAQLHGGRRGPHDPDREEMVALPGLGNAGTASLLTGERGQRPTAAQLAAVQRLAGNGPAATLVAVQRDKGGKGNGGAAGELELSGLPVLPVLSASFGATAKVARDQVGESRESNLEPTAQSLDNLEITREPDAASSAVKELFAKSVRDSAKAEPPALDGTLRLTQRAKSGNVSAGAFTIKGAQLLSVSGKDLERIELAVDDFGQAEATKAAAAKASAELVVDGWDAPIPLLTSTAPTRKGAVEPAGAAFGSKAKHLATSDFEPLRATIALGPAVGRLKAAMSDPRPLSMTYKAGGHDVTLHDCFVSEVRVHAAGGGSAPTASIVIEAERIK